MKSFGIFLVLGILLVIGIIFSVYPQIAPIKADLTFQSIVGVLGGILVIVLLVERVTEIAISIWRDAGADDLRLKIDTLSKDKSKTGDLTQAKDDLTDYQGDTKSIALMIGFSIAVIVCAAGVGLLSSIVDMSKANVNFMRGIDILLTSGLIAGGSDGFHQFTSTLETFFNESKKNMEAKKKS